MAGNDIASVMGEIDRVLATGGFEVIPPPLTIGGIPFEVLRAYAGGPGFLDLVVAVDCLGMTQNELRQRYWLIERIARALDQAGSRRPLTAVLLHDPAAARVPVEDFLRVARVLLVTGVANAEDELAPILPVVLVPTSDVGRDPLEQLIDVYAQRTSSERLVELINAARHSPAAVERQLASWFDEALSGTRESDVYDD